MGIDSRTILRGALLAGLAFAGVCSGQVTCTSVTSTDVYARVEGVTEQVPPIQIGGCTGTATGALTFTITSTVPLTNVGLTGGGVDAVASVSGFTGAPALIAATQTAPTTLQFVIPVTPGSQTGSITVQNIRINASLTASPVISFAADGVEGVSISPTSPIQISFIARTLAPGSFTGYSNISLCSIQPTDVNAVGVVTLASGFNGAFTSDAQEYQKEVSSGASQLSGNPVTQANTIGTRFALTFSNVTNGITYYLPTSVTNGSLTLNLVPAANSTCGASGTCSSAVTGVSIGGPQNAGNTGAGSAVNGVSAFMPANGSFTAYYAVVSDAGGSGPDATAAFSATPPTGSFSSIVLYETVPNTVFAFASAAPQVSISIVGNNTGYAQFSSAASPYTLVAANPLNATNSQGMLTGCPLITSVSPTSTPVNNPTAVISVSGGGFQSGATILFTPPTGGQTQITPSLSQAAQLAATIPSTQLTTAGTAQVAVMAGGVASSSVPFTILPLSIGSLSPASAQLGSSATTVTIPGQYFNSGAVLQWTTPDGRTVPISPSLIQAAQLEATVPAALMTTAGTAQVAVLQPGSPVSNSQWFTISSAPLTVQTNRIPSTVIGTPYLTTLSAAGGSNLPYTWSIPPASLPAGLTLNSTTGVISGTPTASGIFPFTATVTDSATPTPHTASQDYSLLVGQQYVISTIAGGVPPATPVQGTNAALDVVASVARDASGNVYF